jgi:hypothetical protein
VCAACFLAAHHIRTPALLSKLTKCPGPHKLLPWLSSCRQQCPGRHKLLPWLGSCRQQCQGPHKLFPFPVRVRAISECKAIANSFAFGARSVVAYLISLGSANKSLAYLISLGLPSSTLAYLRSWAGWRQRRRWLYLRPPINLSATPARVLCC